MKKIQLKVHEPLSDYEIGKLINDGRKFCNAKVTVHFRDGVRYLHIHDREFDNYKDALNHLQEDARNVLPPNLDEDNNPIKEEEEGNEQRAIGA